jgi:hypothetical protein
VTIVHPLQVVDVPLPETEHDFSVDLIITPDEVIGPRRPPSGLSWAVWVVEALVRADQAINRTSSQYAGGPAY